MYISGKNSVNEILKKNVKIHKAFVYDKFTDQNIISELEERKINIRLVDKKQLDKLVTKNHQGIIVEVDDYNYSTLDEIINSENPLVVILDHLEDPHNLGAIIRTCEAFNITGIIIPKDRSVEVNDTVIRVSAGAAYNMKIAQVTNIVMTMKEMQKNGFWIVGTDMHGDDVSTIDYKGKTGIVIGNEGSGMARLVKESCDFIAEIPMEGKINSLNASVAAGIVIFEATKNRR